MHGVENVVDLKTECLNFVRVGDFKGVYDLLESSSLSVLKFIPARRIFSVCGQFFIWLSSVSCFNDEFDCCVRTEKQCDDLIKMSAIDLLRKDEENWNVSQKYADIIRKEVDNVYAACFVDSHNLFNMNMWYNYADKYNGACVEYKLADLARAMRRLNKCMDIRGVSDMLNLLPITYIDSYKDISSLSDLPEYYKNMFMKLDYWSKESEWRICVKQPLFKPENLLRTMRNMKGFELYCSPVCVYLGPCLFYEKDDYGRYSVHTAKADTARKNLWNSLIASSIRCYNMYFDYTKASLRYRVWE